MHHPHRWIRILSIVVGTLAIATGCTTWRQAPPSALIQRQPLPRVRLVMHDGTMPIVHSSTATGDSIIGFADERRTTRIAYARSAIRRIDQRQFSGRRTALLVVGVPAAAIGVFAGAFYLGTSSGY